MSNYLKKAPFNDWWYWSDILSKRLKTVADIMRENDEKDRAKDVSDISKKLYDLFMGPARKGQKIKTMTEQEKAALKIEEEHAIFEGTNIWRDVLTNLPFISQAVEGYLEIKWQDIDPNIGAKHAEDQKLQTQQTPDGRDAGNAGTEIENVDAAAGRTEKDVQGGSGSSSGKTGGNGSASGAGGSPLRSKKIDPRALELFWGPKGRYDEGIRSGEPADGGLPGILMNYIMAEKSTSNRSPTEYKNDKEFANSYGTKFDMKPPGMGGM